MGCAVHRVWKEIEVIFEFHPWYKAIWVHTPPVGQYDLDWSLLPSKLINFKINKGKPITNTFSWEKPYSNYVSSISFLNNHTFAVQYIHFSVEYWLQETFILVKTKPTKFNIRQHSHQVSLVIYFNMAADNMPGPQSITLPHDANNLFTIKSPQNGAPRL